MKKRNKAQAGVILITLSTLFVITMFIFFYNIIYFTITQESKQVDIIPFTIGAEIEPISIDQPPGYITIPIKRKLGGDNIKIIGVKISIKDSAGDYYNQENEIEFGVLETINIQVPISEITLPIQEISVAYIYEKDGEEKITHFLDIEEPEIKTEESTEPPEEEEPDSVTGFVAYLGGDFTDISYSVVETNDQNFIITGYTKSYGGEDYDILLSKFDSSGNEIWTKSIGEDSLDIGKSIIKTYDNNFIVVGYTRSYGQGYDNVLLIKFDSSGNQIWKKLLEGSSFDMGVAVTETTDNSLIVTGYSNTDSNGLQDIFLTKLDSSGNQIWTKHLGGSSTDLGTWVIETENQDLVVVGRSYSYGNGNNNMLLTRFDSSGNEIWTKSFGGTSQDYLFSVIETNDNSLIVLGSTQSYGGSDYDILLSKFDSSGNEIWTKSLGGDSDDYGNALIELSNNELIVTGSTQSYGGSDYDILLSKFDSSGNEIWTKSLGGDSDDYGKSVIETNNGDLVVSGYTKSYGGADEDILLIKFDSNGEIMGFSDINDETATSVTETLIESEMLDISTTTLDLTQTTPDITESDETATTGIIFPV